PQEQRLVVHRPVGRLGQRGRVLRPAGISVPQPHVRQSPAGTLYGLDSLNIGGNFGEVDLIDARLGDVRPPMRVERPAVLSPLDPLRPLADHYIQDRIRQILGVEIHVAPYEIPDLLQVHSGATPVRSERHQESLGPHWPACGSGSTTRHSWAYARSTRHRP